VHEAVHGACWRTIGKGTQGATATLKAIKDCYYQHFSDLSLNILQNSISREARAPEGCSKCRYTGCASCEWKGRK
jgi:hypothetical protein